jgi:hypothetical protein
MAALKKFRDNYPKDDSSPKKKQGRVDRESQKRDILAYTAKINELLKDPQAQKKAAEILSQLINSK